MPIITVILPVYNGARYLKAAIESVLAQTERDFELLVVDDGSTDSTPDVVQAFTDHRIVYVKNAHNLGLIGSLNKGIGLAKGKYIARMDQDDICLPERFTTQLRYFKEDPVAKVVATPVIPISPGGKLRDRWPADAAAVVYADIVRILPHENCIAHPSVMADAETMRVYLYDKRQKGSEDWDLWLRLVRDGVRIIKTREPLLKYRIHPASSTVLANRRQSPQLRTAAVKWRFFVQSAMQLKLNAFVWRTLFSVVRDIGYHFKSQWWPRTVRRLFYLVSISPFRAQRDWKWLRATNDTRHYFFFSYSHTGGAEKVHAAVAKAVEDKKPLVFFTGLDDRGGRELEFGAADRVRNIAGALYHPWFAKRTRQWLINRIQSAPQPVVMGSNSAFFYDFVLQLPAKTRTIDLTHDVQYAEKPIPVNFLTALLLLKHRVFISSRAINVTRDLYERHFVDDEHFRKLKLIYNCTDTTHPLPARDWNRPFHILYVGRDSAEKRLHLVVKLAEHVKALNLSFRFTIVGDAGKAVKRSAAVVCEGEIHDRGRLNKLFRSAHFVIITSQSEGFPLSLMEGMAHGCIPLATSVGDIPHHVRHLENGLLLPDGSGEVVLDAALDILKNTASLPLSSISASAYHYCRETFSPDRFIAAYRELLS